MTYIPGISFYLLLLELALVLTIALGFSLGLNTES